MKIHFQGDKGKQWQINVDRADLLNYFRNNSDN